MANALIAAIGILLLDSLWFVWNLIERTRLTCWNDELEKRENIAKTEVTSAKDLLRCAEKTLNDCEDILDDAKSEYDRAFHLYTATPVKEDETDDSSQRE